jgi:transcriptional regulator with XRE-family HTH domain
MKIGDMIRKLRTEANFTASELASMVGVHRNTIVNWEGGRTEPTISELIRLADNLDCSVNELVHGSIVASPINDQPPPVSNDKRPIWELVIEDMHARDHVGRERYGMPLQANNGRDALVDAYQEALDLCVYLRQAIEERSGSPSI